ncbi:extensin [Agrobacterium vitis]|uniref:Extensin n=2 Tax=Agrobacterium vitis TaxID=373 RepID=A0A368NHV2_AGRVI|nr:extensin [Agrobacterium vitis]KAA3525253.1 extensin [Agrobacterium vitis]MCF1479291.1 extensin family protein [Agrobacterium vitis]RCU50142.1 extensin [Agrobacterium vitis]
MTEDPQAYNQCLTDLKAAGAQFTERPRIDDGDGCGIDKPLEVTEILPGVSLKPKGTLRCAAALELSQWLKTVVVPAAEQALPDKGRLKGVDQASTYICRNRNSLSTGKMSEHAKGNAIDIAGLEFEKGAVPMKIVPDSEPTLPGAFQRTVNASACLYFTTVLAPGADETHKDHLHLDLIKRRNDFRVCQEPD